MSHTIEPLVTTSPAYSQEHHYNPQKHHCTKFTFMKFGIKTRRIAELLGVQSQTVACALNGGICSIRMNRRLTALARKIESGEVR